MEILQVGTGTLKIPPSGYGGIERYIFEVSRQLARLGRAVTILDIKEKSSEPAVETVQGIKILRLQTRGKNPAGGVFLLQYFRSKLPLVSFAIKASRHVRRKRYDIIHLHVTIIGLVLVCLNRSLRHRMIYTVHSPIWMMDSPGALDRLAVRMDCFLMRRVGHVIAQSESSKAKLMATARIPAQKISVVPSGVDTAAYHSATPDEKIVARYGFAGKSVILFAGRIVPYKGILYLVKAADIVVNRSGYKDALFLLVGPIAQHGLDSLEHSRYIEDLSAFIQDKRLEEHVKLTGAVPQDDLTSLFCACDIFVLPSLAESSPAVTLQAMSCAKPVIGTRVGGVPDQIKDGWNGFLVEPADEEALAQKIKYLLDHPAERLKMGRNGRQLAVQEFDWKVVAEKLLAIYSQR
ncbi:MAG: glycosyltransferase family 1 protein [Dehalococcoidia bacterium]|nr:MAG: glycosyltransferase family 1 protein [Dehalococcoidia bacterium]